MTRRTWATALPPAWTCSRRAPPLPISGAQPHSRACHRAPLCAPDPHAAPRPCTAAMQMLVHAQCTPSPIAALIVSVVDHSRSIIRLLLWHSAHGRAHTEQRRGCRSLREAGCHEFEVLDQVAPPSAAAGEHPAVLATYRPAYASVLYGCWPDIRMQWHWDSQVIGVQMSCLV